MVAKAAGTRSGIGQGLSKWLADDERTTWWWGSAYLVSPSDNGKVIKVRVTFTDDANNEESLTNAGTSAVVGGGL